MANSRLTVTQPWVATLPLMQQTVLLTAIRGPDGLPKEGPWKALQRAYRRTILLSALDERTLETPDEPGGGNFTGPLPIGVTLTECFRQWIGAMDQMPHHYSMHVMHAAEIVGRKHPREATAEAWHKFYEAIVLSLHLELEEPEHMEWRLSGDRESWLEAAESPVGNLESA